MPQSHFSFCQQFKTFITHKTFKLALEHCHNTMDMVLGQPSVIYKQPMKISVSALPLTMLVH